MPQEQLRHGCFSYRIAAVWRKKQKKKEKPEKKRIIYWTKRKVCGIIIPSLTVENQKNRCIPCISWSAAIFAVVTKYSILFPSFAFFLNSSHFAFG